MSMGQLGLLFGAFIFGPLADRFGRKIIMGASVSFFGLFCLISAYSGSIDILVWMRFLTGVGLGGAMPNVITMTSEYCPQRKLSFLVATMFCGYSLGGAFGGVIAAHLISSYGWRSVFVVGGLAPLIMVPVSMILLPESVRFLVLAGKDKAKAKIPNILGRIAPDDRLEEAKFVVKETKLGGFPVKHLFNRELRTATIILWIAYFANIGVIGFTASWLPILIQATGASIQTASLLTSLYYVGCVLTAIVAGFFMDKFNPFKVLTITLALGGVGTVILGNATSTWWLFTLGVFLEGCAGGSMLCINALASQVYPTSVRASGVAWALGVGRLGAVVGAFVGGYMMAAHWGMPLMFEDHCGRHICRRHLYLPVARPRTGRAENPGSGRGARSDRRRRLTLWNFQPLRASRAR